MAVAAVTASLDLISILTFVGYEFEADIRGVALVAVAMFLPMTLLGPAYARLAQRIAARWLIALSLVVRAAATGAMFWVPNLEMLLALVFVRSAAIGLFYPVIAGLAENYQGTGKFAAWANLTNSAARIAAPLVGGVLGVIIGERIVFAVSAVACLCVLPLVLTLKDQAAKRDAVEHEKQQHESKLSLSMMLRLGVPIATVSSLSVMMSNLMPYTLNLFDVPKITLSVALSCSAVTAMLVNIAYVRWRTATPLLPVHMIGLAWMGVVLGFALLATIVPTSAAVILVPVSFALLSASKASFTVAVMGFVFQQPKALATRLASFDQSLGSATGMVATMIGAYSVSGLSPMPMMYVATIIGALICAAWVIVMIGNKRRALV